jgi:hypothetical protein
MHKTFLAVLVAVGLLSSVAASAEEPFSTSVHSEALYLVLTSQREELKSRDPDTDSQEVTPRNWSVFRPAGSGILDMRNTSIVTLSVDGRAIAPWDVNTGEGTVERKNEVMAPALP